MMCLWKVELGLAQSNQGVWAGDWLGDGWVMNSAVFKPNDVHNTSFGLSMQCDCLAQDDGMRTMDYDYTVTILANVVALNVSFQDTFEWQYWSNHEPRVHGTLLCVRHPWG